MTSITLQYTIRYLSCGRSREDDFSSTGQSRGLTEISTIWSMKTMTGCARISSGCFRETGSRSIYLTAEMICRHSRAKMRYSPHWSIWGILRTMRTPERSMCQTKKSKRYSINTWKITEMTICPDSWTSRKKCSMLSLRRTESAPRGWSRVYTMISFPRWNTTMKTPSPARSWSRWSQHLRTTINLSVSFPAGRDLRISYICHCRITLAIRWSLSS